MSEPFLGEIRIFGFNFAPRGWAECDGQILPISQNQSLYSILGTTYGGDGRTTFALPDLRGRVPVHVGRSNGGQYHSLGQKAGEETNTLSAAEMPQHSHQWRATAENAITPATDPANKLFGTGNVDMYTNNAGTLVDMATGTMTNVGGGQAHNNMQPYTTLNFCIAVRGLFPSRN